MVSEKILIQETSKGESFAIKKTNYLNFSNQRDFMAAHISMCDTEHLLTFAAKVVDIIIWPVIIYQYWIHIY